MRAVLIPTHQPRVAHDICRKDGRQSPYNPLAGQKASPMVVPIVGGLVQLGNDEENRACLARLHWTTRYGSNDSSGLR